MANLSEDLKDLTEFGKLHSLDDIATLSDTISGEDGLGGLNFFFGDAKAGTELETKAHFLMNVIIGLQNLNPKGNMILRINSCLSQFTVDLMFIVYSQFESFMPF